jgi:hypothetical protein
MYLRKYDNRGTVLWTRQFGADNAAQGVAVDGTGVYVSGELSTFNGSFDVFLRKYDTSGNELWTRQFGSAADDVYSR